MIESWDESSVLIAVFDSETSARRAAEVVALGSGGGDRVRVGRSADETASVKAEMQEEMDRSWTSPQVGVAYPQEAAKGLAVLTPVCCLIGALLIAPLGFIPVGDVPLWVRLVLAASVGVLMGATVALVAAPSLAARRPDDGLAGERGVVVRVEGTRPDIVEALVAARPLRLDRLRADDLTRVETIDTEGPSDLPTVTSQVIERSTDPTFDADVQSSPETNRTTGTSEDGR